jgi:hypothetical protein
MAKLPAAYWNEPPAEFVELYRERRNQGIERLRKSRVAFVGLARNCGTQLASNLTLLEHVAAGCSKWSLHIESNDCTDDTLEVLARFSKKYARATFHYQTLNRPHCVAEFAGRRTIALAEYRDSCQRWVRSCAADSDYVVAIDWDLWAGWQPDGLANAIGWLTAMPQAYGMASVSLFQHEPIGEQWLHYDLWALRGVGQADCYWDVYQNGYGGFGLSWLPPVGSPPVLVSSAFGGMAVYNAAAYLAGTYDGVSDCEHVPFHHSIAKATGQQLYLCPSMRTLVRWLEPKDAGDSQHSLQGVSGNA